MCDSAEYTIIGQLAAKCPFKPCHGDWNDEMMMQACQLGAGSIISVLPCQGPQHTFCLNSPEATEIR